MAALFTNFIYLHDVRMLQAGNSLSFLAEASDFFGVRMLSGQDNLERHQPLKAGLASFVNAAHAAPTEYAQDFVARNHRPIGVDGSMRSRRAFRARLGG